MRVAETGFDPAQISDLYSSTLAANIFDALYEYDFLARPVRLRPNTAAALPEASADFKTFTIRIKPGIYFSDDPAFKGVRRELTAADYVYSIKRHFDPRWKSPTYTTPQQQPHPRPRRGAPGRAARQEAVRLRHAGRGPARARPLHDPVQARRAEPALHRSAERPGAHRRGRARGGRVLRRQDHGAPGRHRPVPARRSGGAARGSRSRRTRTTATSSTSEEAPPTTRSPRPRSSGSPAASCR